MTVYSPSLNDPNLYLAGTLMLMTVGAWLIQKLLRRWLG